MKEEHFFTETTGWIDFTYPLMKNQWDKIILVFKIRYLFVQ